MTKVIKVSPRKVAAARAQVARDQARGRTSDPRVVAIANAKPAPAQRKHPVEGSARP